jgi:GTPase
VISQETPLPRAAELRPATVAIVGRPNVGKSALFNRLIGRRLAIVEDTPGVTRDRIYALAEWRGRTFTLVDTGGIEVESPADEISAATRAQAEIAARDADVVVFVVDATEGRHPLDDDVIAILRRNRRPVIAVANKAESPRAQAAVPGEFASLGVGTPIAVSALHGDGSGDVLDAIVERLPPGIEPAPESHEIAVALIGQPNVGKSSLLNALLGEERAIVSAQPGTTRDAIDTLFTHKDRQIRLIDTAGVRKKPSAGGAIEYYSSLRALGAIARCDVALLLIDGLRGPLAQDRRLAGMVIEERKGLIVVANKYDLIREQGSYAQSELTAEVHKAMPFAAFAPVTFLSALTKRRLGSLMPLVLRVAENLDRRVPTPQLNTVVRDAVLAHPAPITGSKPLRIFYCSQPGTHPPLFVVHCNDPELVTPSYQRFLENTLRANFAFEGVPLTFDFRERRRDESA